MSARRPPSGTDLPASLRRRRVSRSRPRAGAPVWLFDLDNTLHHASHAIFPEINRAMTQYIVDTLQVERAEADRLRTGYTMRYGAALLGLTRHHPIDPHDFLRVVHTFADLPAMLRAERGLARVVAALPGRKFVLTNAPERYARAVLRELRIERLFERVIAIEHMRDRRTWRAKPDSAMLRRVLRDAHARIEDAILVEDTRGHLKRYKRLGIGTVWITGHLPGHLPSTGRPHYVDRRIRSLKSLRLGTRSGRQKCSRLTRRTTA
ncbi:pyrimidine 5'-nucleotidase [Burkholderia multivorans]|uniref:Pyrimidine 5'-nucleotidase n=1 Tax=Burkholderia multivorans TaxID=87883 RepID=A0AB37AN39_9BURK|nr:pyrimidine 5'-nucleotidase [Burkholderia multivorans]MBU9231363.1 pyrimidine 5'-nucleotidase [Burkholderia multivorans]MBU9376973.1 pyrimidine 5'-nucleotidase [Burkholderia multivorans]MBU9464727.1 pyrimidine 5'-nucleotidase [Burkholderia multivorans]PRE40797.1 pyrimidine 5'-nucleotidase [Burkholderia multivorans]PRE43036.1 pyrimidine 5'-nucleotidase [Burkholderia multivorans]